MFGEAAKIQKATGRQPAQGWRWLRALQSHIGVSHGKRSPSSLLGVHQISTVPSISVLWLSLAFGITVYFASRYQINVGYAMAFSGLTVLMSDAWMSFLMLRGLSLKAEDKAGPCHAGEAMNFSIQIEETLGKRRRHLLIEIGPTQYEVALNPWGKVVLSFQAPAKHRGVLLAPMIRIGTPYPLGLWNTHHLWAPTQKGLVHPEPEPNAPPAYGLSDGNGSDGQAHDARLDGDSLVSLRSYRPGDSPRRIAWRLYARSGGTTLATKETESPGSKAEDVWIDEATLGDVGPNEHRLSRLCAWVLQAAESGIPYGLKTQGSTIDPATGPEHRSACLAVLAMASGHRTETAFATKKT